MKKSKKKSVKRRSDPMLVAALRYARTGWRVVPLHSARHGACTCGRQKCKAVAKHPKIKNWRGQASTDPVRIRAWWRQWPTANVGVATGQESGLIVIDIDRRHGGLESLADLQKRHGRLVTLKALTGGGGVHFYYKHPGTRISNTSGQIAPGIDVKGDEGYIVAPPSLHASGSRYRWDDGQRDLAEIPSWLKKLLTARTRKSGRTFPGEMTEHLRQLLDALETGGYKPTQKRDGEWLAFCPCHDDENTPNLTVSLAEDGRLLLYCFACGANGSDVIKKLGLPVAILAPSPAEGVVLDPSAPYEMAGKFNSSHPHLLYGEGVFRQYNDVFYPVLREEELRAQVYTFIDGARGPKGKKIRVRPRHVTEVVDGLKALCNLPSQLRAPCWRDTCHSDYDPQDTIAFMNCLLHVPDRKVLGHTPSFVVHRALQYEYNPSARKPRRWQEFLRSIWRDDDEQIQTLQEYLGYVISNDTSLQKMLLIVGPKRSGKGTILRVATALVGKENVAAPSLESLCGQFGLSPLLGKSLATITDARVGRRHQQGVEYLLNVSGEDYVNVNRKFKEAVTEKLTTRFIFCANELPELRDSSGAIARRFIVLQMTESFYGRENRHLTEELLEELPGIVNWALEGYRRLNERGYFVQPESTATLLDELEDIGSPIHAFVREKCDIGPDLCVKRDCLYTAYCRWRLMKGYPVANMSSALFGRELRAAVSSIKGGARREKRIRPHVYRGIALKNAQVAQAKSQLSHKKKREGIARDSK